MIFFTPKLYDERFPKHGLGTILLGHLVHKLFGHIMETNMQEELNMLITLSYDSVFAILRKNNIYYIKQLSE